MIIIYTSYINSICLILFTFPGATELPGHITYSLRFPERPRTNSFFSRGSRSWRTDILFPVFEVPGPRSRSSDGGSDPGMYEHKVLISLVQGKA